MIYMRGCFYLMFNEKQGISEFVPLVKEMLPEV